MPSLFSDLWLFVSAIITNWLAYAGGGLIALAIGLFERLSLKYRLTRKAYVSIFVVGFLLIALFMAWREEHRVAVQLNRELQTAKQEWTNSLNNLKQELADTKPKFAADIDMVSTGYSPEMRASQVFILIAIRNLGAPSIAENFQLQVKSNKLDVVTKNPTFINPGYRLYGEGRSVLAVFEREDSIMEKAIKPIEHNGIMRGWLRYVLKEVSNAEELYDLGTTYTVTFSDVTGHEWSASHVIRGERLEEPLRYPGATMPFKTPKKRSQH